MSSVVYFVRLTDYPLVKIGYTNQLKVRLRDHQIGCPFEQQLIATVPGAGPTERLIHRALSGHAYRAEWFYLNAEVQAFIGAISAAGTLADEYAAAYWNERKRLIRDHLEKPDCTFAADSIIATVMPLSSAGDAQ